MITLISLLFISQVLAQESVYIGQIKYSLQPHQPFEHQFFKIDSVNSMDLYFPEPPYKIVNDTDLNCYWSFQEVGIKEIVNWPAEPQYSQGDLVCVGACYLTHHDTLYIINSKQMMGKRVDQIVRYSQVMETVELPTHLINAQIIDLSSRGYLIFYTQKYGELWDIGKGTHLKKLKSELLISKVLQSKCYGVSEFFLFLCIQDQINILNIDDPVAIKELQPLPGGDQIKVINNWLLVYNASLIVYDIIDPFWIRQTNQTYFDSPILLFDCNGTHFISVSSNLTLTLYHFPSFVKILGGEMQLIDKNHPIDKITLKKTGVIMIQRGSVHIVDLVKIKLPSISKHQQLHHLIMSQHILNSTEDKIHIVQDRLVQVSNGLIRQYILSGESYNLVCQAPSTAIIHRYHGVIRSEEKCSEILKQGKEEKLKQIMNLERLQKRENIQCIYTFNLILNVQNPKENDWLLIIGIVILFIVAFYVIIGQQRKSIINENLKKFERLNNESIKNETIRITHMDEMVEEENIQII